MQRPSSPPPGRDSAGTCRDFDIRGVALRPLSGGTLLRNAVPTPMTAFLPRTNAAGVAAMKRPLSIPRDRTAALFIDLQEEHRRDPRYLVEDYEAVLANVRAIQAAARRNRVPLLHCAYVVDLARHARPFHPVLPDGRSAFSDRSDPLTAICAEVAPAEGETSIVKAEASAFGAASPAPRLKAAGIEWLVVAGVWSEACVDATVKDAVALGFRVLLVKDACGSGTAAMHQTAILNLANRLYGGAVVDTGRACALLEGGTVDAWQVEGSVPLRFTFGNAADFYRAL